MAEEKLGVSDDFDDSATEEEEEQPDWLDDLCNMDNEKDGMGPSTSTNHPSASGVHLVNFHASRGISSAQFAGDPGAKKLNIMEMGKLMYEHAVQSGGNVQPPSTAPSKKPTKSKSTYDYESYEYFLPPPPKRSSPAEWEQTKPSAMCLGRIVGDLKEFSVTPIPGITVYSYESNITKMLALISGPAGTPYEGGFFQFYLHCPPDYPINSPHARFLTTDGQTVRFNPNLYANGYICLSLLGTWSGPAWSCAQSISTLLLSIQSLMGEFPYHNEPGYENLPKHDQNVLNYNTVIRHETIRVAVIGAVEEALAQMKVSRCVPSVMVPPGDQAGPADQNIVLPETFTSAIFTGFISNFSTYLKICEENLSLNRSVMADGFGDRRGSFEWTVLITKLRHLKRQIEELQEIRVGN